MRNHYRKKSMLALAATMLVPAFSMQAGWGSDETPAIVLRQSQEIATMHTARTADGKTYITWAQWSGIVGDGYNLHIQLLDADGNAMWGEEGFVLETKPNASWFADYSLVATPEGDAVISWADAREDTEDNYQSQTPVLYKINQQKEMLWGEDGVFLGNDYRFPPVLYPVGGDIYAKIYPNDEYGSSILVRLDSEGAFATDPMEFGGMVIASADSDFIGVYMGSAGTEAMRYNRDMQPVWSAPAIVSSELYQGYDNEPYKLVSDGLGGVVVSFIKPLNMFQHIPVVQYITAEGEAVFGEAADVIITDSFDHSYPVLAVDSSDQTIFCTWQVSGGISMLAAQQFDFFGERLWGEAGISLADKDEPAGWSYGPIAAASLSDNTWFVCYADELAWASNQLYLAAYDHEGNLVWRRPMAEPGAVNDYSCYVEGDDYYMFWVNEVTDDDWNTEYMIQTVKVSDLTSGVESVSSESAEKKVDAYYSLDGARHNSPVKGVNIVRYTDGSSRKMMVK